MNRELSRAAIDAKELLGQLGRASTPPVPDRGIPLQTHISDQRGAPCFPAAFIGDSTYFRDRGVICVEIHPNDIGTFVEKPERYQALVVNCHNLNGPWSGADTGWASWKSDLVFESTRTFKSAGIPVYLIKPEKPGAPFIRWSALTNAIFPGFVNAAEETWNPHTQLWIALNEMDTNK